MKSLRRWLALLLILGSYASLAVQAVRAQDDRPLEERAPINVDKMNFTEVMAQQNLKVDVSVADNHSPECLRAPSCPLTPSPGKALSRRTRVAG